MEIHWTGKSLEYYEKNLEEAKLLVQNQENHGFEICEDGNELELRDKNAKDFEEFMIETLNSVK